VTVQAWFATHDAEIEPGSSMKLSMTITNLGNSTDSFALTPSGLAASWTTIRPAYITLFGGAQETVEIELSPPRLPSTTAGPVALGIRVVPQSTPDDVEVAEVTLHVGLTYDRRISMLQPALRARRRATFELLVENQGNSQASCRMHLIDPTGRLDGDFDPPAVGIEPGGTSLVRLKLHATRRQWERRSRSIPFRVEADQQGAPAAEVTAAFVQAPVLPERLGSRFVALLAVAGLAAAGWVWLLRPAIDRAAQDAVSDLPPVQVTATTTSPGVTTPTTVPTSEAPVADDGDPQSILLPGSAAEGQSSSQPWTVPDGKALLVTDYLVQNPAGDSGTATLTFGDPTTALEWDMAVHLDGVDVTNRFTTPIRLEAGQQVVFDVTCVSPGRPGSSACSARAFINGRLVDA
jgi:hypothetical protein